MPPCYGGGCLGLARIMLASLRDTSSRSRVSQGHGKILQGVSKVSRGLCRGEGREGGSVQFGLKEGTRVRPPTTIGL
eukprot:6570413-Pyramimonas_sp.AAC.1